MNRREWDEVLSDYGVRFGYPRVVGAYLGVNAVPDLWMLVDSADCATLRAEMIQDNHDWNSTLISADGKHRIANTGLCPESVVLDRRELMAAQMAAIGRQSGAMLLAYPSAVASMVGVDYDSIYRTVKERMGMPVVTIRPVEALGDWCSGYAQVMEAVAEHIVLPEVSPRDDAVAVVGYLWDRNEADHEANVAELARMLAGAGLELVSTWFSGRPTTELSRVAEASLIVALPHAGRSAEMLAARTGAKVIHTGLPLGLSASAEWIRTVASALDAPAAPLSSRAEAWLTAELPGYYRKLRKAVSRWFVNREFLVCTESHLAAAVTRMLREMGGVVRLVALSGPAVEVDPGLSGIALHAPSLRELWLETKRITEAAQRLPVLIANEQAVGSIATLAVGGVFLGFQSPGMHHLFDAPFLGLKGTLCLTDRIVNSVPLSMSLHR